MVSGFTKFMENEELPFRATKDVDIVLIVESITAEFVGDPFK